MCLKYHLSFALLLINNAKFLTDNIYFIIFSFPFIVVFAAMQQTSITLFILVEQYFDFAYNLADSFVVLKRGEVTKSGTKQKLSKEILLNAVSV